MHVLLVLLSLFTFVDEDVQETKSRLLGSGNKSWIKKGIVSVLGVKNRKVESYTFVNEEILIHSICVNGACTENEKYWKVEKSKSNDIAIKIGSSKYLVTFGDISDLHDVVYLLKISNERMDTSDEIELVYLRDI